MLQRRATGWLDTTPGSLEASVVRFASAYAAPVPEATDLDVGLDEQLLVPWRWRGYHGPVQPSRHVASARDGASELRPRLEALAAWAEEGARSPLLTAAVVHGALLALHPFRDANRRMAVHAAEIGAASPAARPDDRRRDDDPPRRPARPLTLATRHRVRSVQWKVFNAR